MMFDLELVLALLVILLLLFAWHFGAHTKRSEASDLTALSSNAVVRPQVLRLDLQTFERASGEKISKEHCVITVVEKGPLVLCLVVLAYSLARERTNAPSVTRVELQHLLNEFSRIVTELLLLVVVVVVVELFSINTKLLIARYDDEPINENKHSLSCYCLR